METLDQADAVEYSTVSKLDEREVEATDGTAETDE